MALVINTNVASLNAQRNLDKSQNSLQEAMQRLSTGLRINSAKDDAAGLAIATRFTTQIRGLDQAVRNANDGISLVQTGDSALSELTNNLQRIRELAVQSANATNSASDRAALDQEVQQRLAEITRIASQTSFNGQNILDGSFGNAQFQVGANVGETISVSFLTGVRSNQIGQIALQTGVQTSATGLAAGAMQITIGSDQAIAIAASVAGATPANGQTIASAWAKANAIINSNVNGLTVSASTRVDVDWTDTTATENNYDLNINGEDIYLNYDSAISGNLSASAVATAINLQTSDTGVTATFTASTLSLFSAEGRDIHIVESSEEATQGLTVSATSPAFVNDLSTAVNAATFTNVAVDVTFGGQVKLSAVENIVFSGTGAVDVGFASNTSSILRDTNTLATQNVTTVSNSEDTILRVDAALTSISNLRSEFGAVQNRFSSIIVNLQTSSENLSAARGRIVDADFAAETSKLIKAQILQAAGIIVLAQANQQPRSVLELLA